MIDSEIRFADDVEMLDFPVRGNLTWRERREVEFLRTINRGVMLVSGPGGSGKDLFATYLAALNKYYFADLLDASRPRRVLLDFLPKRAFGEYVLFNDEFMMQQIDEMAKASKMGKVYESNDQKEAVEFMDYATDGWIRDKGAILLQGSLLYCQELKRYFHNRNPHNPFNKFLGKIIDQVRHLDMLFIGSHIDPEELDEKAFLRKVTHWAKCSWSYSMPDTTHVILTRGRFMMGNNVWNLQSHPVILDVNGGEPKKFLDGNRVYDLYPSKNFHDLAPVIMRKGKKENG